MLAPVVEEVRALAPVVEEVCLEAEAGVAWAVVAPVVAGASASTSRAAAARVRDALLIMGFRCPGYIPANEPGTTGACLTSLI
ncbi:hypothetical protein GCM10009630_19310 [Kribbella jejuensis]